MAKLTGGKRILTEDFRREDSPFIQKLAFILNPFMEQIINAFNKNLTVTDNLNMEFKEVTIDVDGSGIPVNSNKFQTQFSNINGLHVINHRVLTAGASPYPSSAIYCSFKQTSNVIEIQHVTGLTAGVRYSLKLLVLGQ